ncbi:MAG: hypothetical protein DYG98_12055 [Haliscomenobacteraceae bacterium CHB4]|nr:hypothetical protein [Haliscomenobacteraceae bacterium CHB4]
MSFQTNSALPGYSTGRAENIFPDCDSALLRYRIRFTTFGVIGWVIKLMILEEIMFIAFM